MTEKKTLDHLSDTEVFETYWRNASERQAIYERRLRGDPPPWTDDPIFAQYKFTNAFRAADRVSQYLIRHVIYTPEATMEDQEVVFRVLLFKLFNSIAAWETLKEGLLDVPSWRTFDAQAYATILGKAKARGVKIWNAAYMQKPQYREDLGTKHERYLALLQYMMQDRVTQKLKAARSYQEAFFVLRGYPLYGHAASNGPQLFSGA